MWWKQVNADVVENLNRILLPCLY